MKPAIALAGTITLIVALTGCGTNSAASSGEHPLPTTLTVFAATSLKTPMDKLVDRFERDNPGLKVTVNYGGSSTLVQQLRDGAPADVLMTADEPAMTKAVDDKLAKSPTPFATNTLTLAVAPGNPLKLTGAADSLAQSKLAVCAPQVPCGRAAVELQKKQNVTWTPISQEANVGDVVAKVTSGQADAGVVYTTDVAASKGKLEAVPLNHSREVINRYMVAETTKSNEMGQYWVILMRSPTAADILREAGFGPP